MTRVRPRTIRRRNGPGRLGRSPLSSCEGFCRLTPFSREGVMLPELDPFAAVSAIPRSIGTYQVTALLREDEAGALCAVADVDRGQILSIGIGVGTAPWHKPH